jgi:hypothetical protein
MVNKRDSEHRIPWRSFRAGPVGGVAADQSRTPQITGALLNAAKQALKTLAATRSSLKGKLPRMADAAAWICAGETALGYPPGTFLKEHARMIQFSRYDALDSDPVGQAIVSYYDRHHQDNAEWVDMFGKILDAIRGETDWDSKRDRRNDPLKSTKTFSSHLTRIAPILEAAAGIFMQRLGRRRDGYLWKITRNPNHNPKETSI